MEQKNLPVKEKRFKWEITDPSLFKMWLEEKYELAGSTISVYVIALKGFLYTDPDIEELGSYNSFLIDTAIKKRGTMHYAVLKRYIQFKISDSALKSKLISGMIKPKVKPNLWDRKYLEEDKLLELINALEKKKHKVIALIQMMTGVRAGDILSIKNNGITPEVYEGKEVLRLNIIGKRMKRNIVYLHDEAAQKVILDYVQSLRMNTYDDYIFLDKPKMRKRISDKDELFAIKKINYMWFRADLKYAMNIIGIDKEDFSTHDFRRCFARRAWNKWKDVQILQKLLNHTDPKNTLRYLEQSGLQNIDYHAEMQKF